MFVFGLMIPLGLLLLVLSIKHTVKVYTVTAIHDMPYRTDKGIFTIQTAGRYGIWLNGNRFKKAPLGLFGLQLINCETEKEVPLRANLIPVSVTKESTYDLNSIHFMLIRGRISYYLTISLVG